METSIPETSGTRAANVTALDGRIRWAFTAARALDLINQVLSSEIRPTSVGLFFWLVLIEKQCIVVVSRPTELLYAIRK